MKRKISVILLILSFSQISQANEGRFLWGAASAAFQVEGSPKASDWTLWTEQEGKIIDKTNANIATDFWNRYEEDFLIAKNMGLNSYRMSIAWERIFPESGKLDSAALKKYGQIILKMKEHGLEPLVTLHHFVLPAWLSKQGGLLAPAFVQEFNLYATTVVKELAAAPYSVKYWMTFNEPNVLIHSGYLDGLWPPGKKGAMNEAVQATAQIIRAHISAVNSIKEISPSLFVSVAHHWRDFQPKHAWNPLDWVASKITDKVWNDQLISSLKTGKLHVWMPGGGSVKEDLKLTAKSGLDFLGINYYGRAIMTTSLKAPFVVPSEGSGEKSDMGWELYPEGLESSLKNAGKRFGLPLLVSENGLADKSDSKRGKFIEAHVAAMKRAQSKGATVLGYYYWSLTDNFEWAYGLGPRFGLVEIDYQNMAKRILRPSAEVYSRIVKESLNTP